MLTVTIENIDDFNSYVENYSDVDILIFHGTLSFKDTVVNQLMKVKLLIFDEKCTQSTLFATNFFNADTIVYNCEILNLDSLTYAKSSNIVIRLSEYRKFPKEIRDKLRYNFNSNKDNKSNRNNRSNRNNKSNKEGRNLKILSSDNFDLYCNSLIDSL